MSLHPTALIAPGARLGSGVRVGPFCVIEDDVGVGDRSEIRAHAVVKRYTTLGMDNTVHEGAVLGGEPQDVSYVEARTELRIGSGNRIREGVTIHRGSKPGSATVVGDECFLMACVHVAHDDQIGNKVVLANNVALAGHVSVGEQAFLGGGAGVHQFCRIGRLAMIGGHAKVVQDCLPFVISDGAPARARGLNLVGLRRAGFGSAQVRTLKEAYRLLLGSQLPLRAALERLGELQDPLADELAGFVRSAKRGFAHAARGAPE